MLKKKQVLKKTLKKSLPKAKGSIKTKKPSVRRVLPKETASETVRPNLMTAEIKETNAMKEWRKKKRDYWRNRFGQILAEVPAKGKGKKQAL